MALDINMLLSELKHEDWKVRHGAIQKLEYIGDSRAATGLAQALKTDESPYVRMASARALGNLGSSKNVPALLDAMKNDPFEHVRYNALWALGMLGEEARDALDELKKHTDDETWFRQAEITVGKLAQTAVATIEKAIALADAPPEQPSDDASSEAESGKKKLTAEERKAKREAALARKRAREEGEE